MDRRRKQEECLFLTAYALWLLSALLGISQWKTLGFVGEARDFIEAAAYLLLLAQFLTRAKYTGRDIAGLFLIVAGCALSGHALYNDQLIPVAIFLCFAQDIDYRKILKWTFLVQAVFMAVTVAAAQFGLIEDLIWNEQGRMRHSLGYNYCGYPAHLLLFMTLTWFCAREKIRIPEGLVLLALNYLMYRATDSRTDFYLAVLGTAGFFVWTREYRVAWVDRIRGFAVKYAFLILTVATTALQYFYRPEIGWMQRLNEALNGRLDLGNQAIQTYGFSLFGEAIRWFGQGSLMKDAERTYNYVDCAYLKEMLTYGVLFVALLAFGYYLLGKKIMREKDHALGWAVLMTLAYSTINAHLCVLAFNVFILALAGISMELKPRTSAEPEEDKEPYKEIQPGKTEETVETIDAGKVLSTQTGEQADRPGARIRQRVNRLQKEFGTQADRPGVRIGQRMHRFQKEFGTQTDKLMAAVAECCPARIDGKLRSGLRVAVLFLVLCYATVAQRMGGSVLTQYAPMHMWLVCGALLLLTLLCCEENGQRRLKGGGLLRLTIIFLLLACLSDLLVSKKFQYGGFCLLAFGGLFCRAWCNMRDPGQLIGEFRIACRIWFALVLACCVVFVPAVPGICYVGVFADAGYLGVSMLPALAVFLSGVTDRKTGIPDGVCAVLALYLIWLSQQPLLFLAAAALAGVYLIFWLFLWFRTDGKEKARQALWAVCAAAVGASLVLLLRELLYHVTPLWGNGLASGDETIQESVAESLSGGGWIALIRDRLWNCKEYLKQMNLFGHKYLAEFAGKKRWALNSVAMNGFRYGIAAGAAYAAMLAVYLWQAVKNSFREKDFLPVGIAFACLAAAMTEAVEKPFAQVAWLGLYFGLAWMLVSGRGEKKDAVSEHGNRQSDL